MVDAARTTIQRFVTGADDYPGRVICLTEETVEMMYLLGQQDRIVGVSGYAVRPPAVRAKPKVSAFINAKFDKILDLQPDLVLTFSDLQAEIARELITRGVTVLAFNQRSVAEIVQAMMLLARVLGCEERGRQVVNEWSGQLETICRSAERFPFRPRVFFEEWKDPLISGITWTEELVAIAGGEPIFPELLGQKAAKDRIVTADQVRARDPHVILASWCGMKVQKDAIRTRPGWSSVAAVQSGHIYEIKSTYILQPGPAALTEGVRQIHAILAHTFDLSIDYFLQPAEKIDPDLTFRLAGVR